MTRKLINMYFFKIGDWNVGDPIALEEFEPAGPFGNVSVRIYEISLSGMALLSPINGNLTSYGTAEVFVKINKYNQQHKYLSAPLNTPIRFNGVDSLELGILFLIGNDGCASIKYTACFNAHCIYRIL